MFDFEAMKIVGFGAAALTSFGFLPQIIKMWRTRSVQDISVLTIWQNTVGVTLWLIYSFSLGDPIIIAANVVSLTILSVAVLLYHRTRLSRLENAVLNSVRAAGELELNLVEFIRHQSQVLANETAKSGGDLVAMAKQVTLGVARGARVAGQDVRPAVQSSIEGTVAGAMTGAESAGLSVPSVAESRAAPDATEGVFAGLDAAADQFSGSSGDSFRERARKHPDRGEVEPAS